MAPKHGMVCGLLLACVLLLGTPTSGFSASVGNILRAKDTFSDVGDALRDADHARERYHQHRSDPDAARYEREWRDYEYKLEETRINRMAREGNSSPDALRKMRADGRSWEDISKHHRIDSRKMGYGHKGPYGYDRDRDHDMQRRFYKKDHPGKAKGHYKGTGDGPPGQYKKNKQP